MKKIILFCLVILTFAACKKGDNPKVVIPPDTIKKTPPDTVFTKPDTMLVSAMISGNLVSRFQYDSNKRLVQEVDSQTYSVGEITTTSKFNYDAHGNLIRREVSDMDGDTVWTVTYNNGLPVSAAYVASSVWGDHYNSSLKYKVVNNHISEIDGAIYPSDLVIKLTYSGNNITGISATGTHFNSVADYSYGLKNSPFAASRFKWFLFPDWLPLTEYEMYGQQYPVNMFNQNDLESLSVSSNPASSFTFTNQYNSSGYPTQVIQTSGSGKSRTITFQYTK
jgi:hypothetical protein